MRTGVLVGAGDWREIATESGTRAVVEAEPVAWSRAGDGAGCVRYGSDGLSVLFSTAGSLSRCDEGAEGFKGLARSAGRETRTGSMDDDGLSVADWTSTASWGRIEALGRRLKLARPGFNMGPAEAPTELRFLSRSRLPTIELEAVDRKLLVRAGGRADTALVVDDPATDWTNGIAIR